VAHILRERGYNAVVIRGGLDAWKKAGRPLEPVPTEDVILLPTFARTPAAHGRAKQT
jgi:3-mercaptopyruvate sulfurtransferase SseA